MSSTVKIIAGIAVIAMVFVGVGYAITYTASTTVEDNVIESAYITVNDGVSDANAKLFKNAKIPYDTTTSNGVVTKNAKTGTVVSDTGAIKIGKTNNLTGNTCTVVLTESTTSIINDRFTMTLGGQAGAYSAGTWTFSGVSLSVSGTSNTLELRTVASGTLSFTDAELTSLASGIDFNILCSLEVA